MNLQNLLKNSMGSGNAVVAVRRQQKQLRWQQRWQRHLQDLVHADLYTFVELMANARSKDVGDPCSANLVPDATAAGIADIIDDHNPKKTTRPDGVADDTWGAAGAPGARGVQPIENASRHGGRAAAA